MPDSRTVDAERFAEGDLIECAPSSERQQVDMLRRREANLRGFLLGENHQDLVRASYQKARSFMKIGRRVAEFDRGFAHGLPSYIIVCILTNNAWERDADLMDTEVVIRDCLGPPARVSRPTWSLPAGSWDTHFHVLGPQNRFPFAANRKYTPPDASFEACRSFHQALGIERGFVVHANTHGFDNTVDLDATARSEGQYLAVVRLDGTATPESCRALHRAGARGVRFAFNPQHGGTLDCAVFDHVLHCIGDLGWFVELHFAGSALPELESWIASIPIPVVIDHFGRIDPRHGLYDPSFEVLVSLAGRDNIWVKISGADRISHQGQPYTDVVPFAHRLVAVAPERLLWGSDWPHTGYFDAGRFPDAGKLLDAFAAFVPEERVRTAILVDNPLRLLGEATIPPLCLD